MQFVSGKRASSNASFSARRGRSPGSRLARSFSPRTSSCHARAVRDAADRNVPVDDAFDRGSFTPGHNSIHDCFFTPSHLEGIAAMTTDVAGEFRSAVARPSRRRQQKEPTLGSIELVRRAACAPKHARDRRRDCLEGRLLLACTKPRRAICQGPGNANRGVRRYVFVQPFDARRQTTTHRPCPSRAIDTGAGDGADPVAMRAPLPFERVVAECVPRRVQVDVAKCSCDVPLVVLDLLGLRETLPVEREIRMHRCLHPETECRKHTGEGSQGDVGLDVSEQMYVIGHKHARDDIEASRDATPQIRAGEAFMEGTRTGSRARNEMQQLEVCHL